MDNTSINDIFPEELVEKVLRKLPPASLKAALLVCRTWKRLGEQPKLWWWINLKVTIRNLAVMPQVLAMDRLKTMTELRLFALSEELMNSIVSHPELKMLNFHFSCSLSSAEPALLATVINKMEEVDFGGPLKPWKADLTPQQCQAIFNFFGSNSKLRKLKISYINLSSVDPQALAKAVTMLEEVERDGSDLNDQQCQTIFQFLNGKSKLKVLYIGDNDLHSVQPEVLVGAITKLEEVNLIDAELTAQQCQRIFHLLNCESKLKKLCIAGNDLSSVPPKTLAKAIIKLEEVILTSTELTPEQCQSIFKLASYNSKLRTLWIGWNDLTSVDPAAVAKVVIKLEEVSLSNATLTAEQYQTIIKFASSNSSQLKKVFMDSNDLSSVGPEDLAKAISKLKEVGLSSVKLTAVQCQAIFKLASCDSSKLNKVHIAYTDLSSVDSENLAKAVTKLEEARLSHTKLTPGQSQKFFNIASCETKLKILDVRGNDLSSVDPVIFKMEDVCLSRTKLTHQQCQTIFNLAPCESKLKNIGLCENDLSCVDPEVLGKVVNKMEMVWLNSTQLTTLQCEIIFKFVLGDTMLIKLYMIGNDFSNVNSKTLDQVDAKFFIYLGFQM